MKHLLPLALAAIAAGALASSAYANGLKRLYALDCGRILVKDQSRWTPGINVGQEKWFSNNCYLIQHERGTLVWETGLPDSIVEQKDGVDTPNFRMHRDKTLVGQLAEIGIKPDDTTYVAMSHSHADHTGNAKLFTKPKFLMQKLEHEFAMKIVPKPMNDGANVQILEGDHDVFGDGSVMIISTPGHTPGHQVLLVKLPKTGALILSGDLVHFQYMWDNKLVPPFNFNKDQSTASIERVAKLLADHKGKLWIGHDKDNTDKVDRAPKYYE